MKKLILLALTSVVMFSGCKKDSTAEDVLSIFTSTMSCTIDGKVWQPVLIKIAHYDETTKTLSLTGTSNGESIVITTNVAAAADTDYLVTTDIVTPKIQFTLLYQTGGVSGINFANTYSALSGKLHIGTFDLVNKKVSGTFEVVAKNLTLANVNITGGTFSMDLK